MKKKFILHDQVNPEIKVGDIVKIDIATSMTLIGHETQEFHTNMSYPNIFGTEQLLKHCWAKVVEVGVKGHGTEAVSENNIYVQDVVIQVAGRAMCLINSTHLRHPNMNDAKDMKQLKRRVIIIGGNGQMPKELEAIIEEIAREI